MEEEFSHEVLEEVAVLSGNARGWRKELNLTSWNGYPPKLDLHEWVPDREKMDKGITLTNGEFAELNKTIKSMQKEHPVNEKYDWVWKKGHSK